MVEEREEVIERMPKAGGKTMSDEAILAKAVKKAIAGGWQPYAKMTKENIQYLLTTDTPSEFIFNHDFAKALWGEDRQPYVIVDDEFAAFGEGDNVTHYAPKWKVMLRQMVVASDPIDYLGQHI